MNHLTTVLSRRFHHRHKSKRSQPTKDSPSNFVLLKTRLEDDHQSDRDESINWCPAPDFLKLESASNYSFVLPDYQAANDGNGFQHLVDALIKQLEEHIKRANSLISSNEKVPTLNEDVEELLRVAIGRTQLLLNKRMRQFTDHLQQYLHPVNGNKPTKLDDLHGLWALIEMQLADIRGCFGSIEECRLANWNFVPKNESAK